MAGPVASQFEWSRGARSADRSEVRGSMPAFLVCGMIVAFLGAVLPAWGYHLKDDFVGVGEYFLSLSAGFWLAEMLARWLLPRKGLKLTLVLANVLACAGFLFLAFSSPLASVLWRLGGVLWLGMSAGFLHACIFLAIFSHASDVCAATVKQAWAWFGLGCVLTALLVAGTYYAYTVPVILMLFAILPGVYAVYCFKAALPPQRPQTPVQFSEVLRELNHPGAVLFSLLLFVQFGNEWAIGGWLALFLIRRLGISPPLALLLLATYWSVLLVGREIFPLLLSKVSPALTRTGSIFASLLGTIVLASTNNRFGAVMGILFVGVGFASIYQCVGEQMIHRFPAYRASLYNGIFLAGVTGGFLAPWLLGYVARVWGIGAVMIAPMLGAFAVLGIALLILLEGKLSGWEARN